uniref:SIN3-HDAC complex-associated factor n=1 Tax=Geotrypetes seraphini TaxID=260995 RepID=A0A6P8P3T2_GEOSA|nr:SIN3-HDAC complex-associated factor [Geotrypetes seraphini]
MLMRALHMLIRGKKVAGRVLRTPGQEGETRESLQFAAGVFRLTAMFGFHKSKIYRSLSGCCICKTKSSSSRFTDSQKYQENFRLCFGLLEDRSGEICNACVLLVKRWKKLPPGSKKNWSHVVDARAGPGFKFTKPKRINRIVGLKHKRKLKTIQKHSDAHSTSSSSPSQSPSYSHQSDESSDVEDQRIHPSVPVFSFLDLTYWKRQKICCGIIYKGRFGEILIDPRLFKPCCSRKREAKCCEQSNTPLP